MTILPKEMERFNTIPIKIPTQFKDYSNSHVKIKKNQGYRRQCYVIIELLEVSLFMISSFTTGGYEN